MKVRLIGILAFLFSLAANAQDACPLDSYIAEVYENPLNQRYLSKYDLKFYHISLDVSNEDTYIEGFATINVEALEVMDTLVFQLISSLEVTGVTINDIEEEGYKHRDDAIYIPVTAVEGDKLSAQISYKGTAGQDNGFFTGISSEYDSDIDDHVTYTLSEPLNALYWFPVKQVLTDKADSVWVDLICDKDLMAGSNGLLEEVENISLKKHKFKWRSNYPIAYYLISLAVADYRDYSFYAKLSNGVDSVLVQNYIYNSDTYFNTWKSDIDNTGDMITLYSELFGDYPFADEKYGHCVAPMGGGMEHQTMTTLDNFNFSLVSHELAHMWFGDDVTCGSWQDIWINEGFASYTEYLALQNLRSQDEADQWMANAHYYASENDGSVYVPIDMAENENRVFSYGLSYKKGATLLHMIRYELNEDDIFFNVLRTYLERYGDSTATASNFRAVLEELSEVDFSCFFDQWYYGKGYPSFTLNSFQEGDSLFIKTEQTTSNIETPLFRMHFDVKIFHDGGSDIFRLYQDENVENFTLYYPYNVTGITMDPQKHLLAHIDASFASMGEEALRIGPNPFWDFLQIRFRGDKNFNKAEIFTLDGKLIITREVNSNPFEFDLRSLEQGAYLLVLYGDAGVMKEKIIKDN